MSGNSEEHLDKLASEATAKLAPLVSPSGDIEANHYLGDQILCELLKELGFDDVVEAWEKIPKWYA